MPYDVFISYQREQRPQVLLIAERLQELGLSVWFDARLEPGTTFDEEIHQEVRTAKAVVVCWTAEAVASRWVRAEATIGHQRDVLATVFLEPIELPPPFNLVQTEDLTGWQGQSDHSGWLRLVDRLLALVRSPAQPAAPRLNFSFEPKVRFNRMPPPRPGERWTEVATYRAGKATFPPWTKEEAALTALEWTSRSGTLFTAGQISGLRCWRQSGGAVARMKIKGHHDTRTIAVADFRVPTLIATGGFGNLCLWQSQQSYPESVRQLELEFTGSVTALAWQPTPDYGASIPLLAASTSRDEISLWDVREGAEVWAHPCHVAHRLDWSPTGDHLAVPAYFYDNFEIFRLDGERLLFKTTEDDSENRYSRPRAGFCWHPSGRYFATGISAREIGIFALASLTRMRTFLLEPGHREPREVHWSPDGRWMVVSTKVGTAVVIDANRGTTRAELYGVQIEWEDLDLAVSPDGQRLATRGKNRLQIWDPTRGEEIAEITAAGGIRQIRWHPDSQRIAFADQNGRVRIACLEF
jgi:hypothetical protein